ncbi:MAG: hypothetical protein LBK26_03020 [Rickettsiales bacterium]|jgi:hypothetical protein|nr:hypothetical protein [Rickettsiales bacterium]
MKKKVYLISCTKEKNGQSGDGIKYVARDLYSGPSFTCAMLRPEIKSAIRANRVFIFSGYYGLVELWQEIEWYDKHFVANATEEERVKLITKIKNDLARRGFKNANADFIFYGKEDYWNAIKKHWPEIKFCAYNGSYEMRA